MNIKPYDTTIHALLKSGFYRIPRFQRPYSWDRENLNDFWQDTLTAEDEDYFIGSFVIYKDKDLQDLRYVVDGQQRLTTITILFAVLRDTLLMLPTQSAPSARSVAEGIHGLIEHPDINNQNQFVLQSETPYPFLQEHIQKFGAPEVPPGAGAEEDSLREAYSFLKQQVAGATESIDRDTTVAEDKRPERKQLKLVSLRDKLLRLKLIVVELDNEDDAYLIFETLNTRGKDLKISDLVKNHLTRLLRPKTKGVDLSKEKWLSIPKLFDEADVKIDINSFILHAWLSRFAYIPQKKLFREMKRMITADNASGFLDDLVSDSKLYRELLDSDYFPREKVTRVIREAIFALNDFHVEQPLPMMLAILRAYEAGDLTLKQTEQIFSTLENFHVLFTAITAQRTGGGTAQMYASSALQLFAAKDKNARMRVLNEFKQKLRDRVPSPGAVEASVREIYFTSIQTKQRFGCATSSPSLRSTLARRQYTS